MVNVEVMIKALRLAWIPGLLSTGIRNWRTVPDHVFQTVWRSEFSFKMKL